MAVNRLKSWLEDNDRDVKWLAARLRVSRDAVYHWLRPTRDHKRRVPRPKEMRRLFLLSGGAVRPQDFYPIERWEKEVVALQEAAMRQGVAGTPVTQNAEKGAGI